MPVLGWLFRLARPFRSRSKRKTLPPTKPRSSAQPRCCEGDLLAIFPEGGITKDGELQPFKGGIMKIIERAQADGIQAPVVPMALTNPGFHFSCIDAAAMVRPSAGACFTTWA